MISLRCDPPIKPIKAVPQGGATSLNLEVVVGHILALSAASVEAASRLGFGKNGLQLFQDDPCLSG